MSVEERTDFLTEARVALCAIARDNGRSPHVSPLWFEYDESGLSVIVESGSEKQRLLRRGSPVTICIQDESPPYAYVTIEGRVADIREASYQEHFNLARRYLPQGIAEAYMETVGSRSKNFRIQIEPLRWLSFRYRRPAAERREHQ